MSDAKSPRMLEILPRIGWGAFLLILIAAAFFASESPLGTTFLAIAAVAVVLATRFPYGAFYLSLVTSLLLGILVSIPAGEIRFGDRAFGGAIDATLGELVAAAVLAAWAIRIFTLWRGRRDWNWKPYLPLFGAYLLLVGAHLLSVFSPANPDPAIVLKYSLRPVFLAYIISVALPANFIRSRRRLRAALLMIATVGVFFALDGFRSLFVLEGGDLFLYRARPLPILGVSPIGENHNVLAELLLFAAPAALAFGFLSRLREERLSAFVAAGFMLAITLLTFARSAWIALAVETLIIAATIGRSYVRRHARVLGIALLLFLPLASYMIVFSSSAGVKSSTDARAMLTGIAWQLFVDNPVVGSGAGTFVDRVVRTRAYAIEFGTPMDSHGVLQKITAETGLLGLAAFVFLCALIALTLTRAWKSIGIDTPDGRAFAFLVAAVAGAFTYQIFNTTYWTAKLWLPVGIALAASRILEGRQERDPDFLASYEG